MRQKTATPLKNLISTKITNDTNLEYRILPVHIKLYPVMEK